MELDIITLESNIALAFLAVIFSLFYLCFSHVVILTVIKFMYLCPSDKELVSRSCQAVLITGCDSGIGLQLAKYFHENTSFTIICGFLDDVTSPGYLQLSQMASGGSGCSRLITVALYITTDSEIEEIVSLLNGLIEERRLSGLHALINNAGVMTYGELGWLTSEQILKQIQVNLIGTVNLTRALLPLIIRNQGRTINISSVNDFSVFPGLSIYPATKSAIAALSRGLGYELRKFGAHVVTVRLGDFARLANIMNGHSKDRDKMWSEMSVEKRKLYGNYFDQFNNHLLENYGTTSARDFKDSNIFSDFRRALLSKSPPPMITCAPVAFKIFYSIMELSPIWMHYYLFDLLFKFSFDWRRPIGGLIDQNDK